MRYRLIDAVAETVTVHVDGNVVEIPAGRSLLAGLAVAGLAPAFFCAIGQCQRCVVRINGRAEIACLATPREGDDVETHSCPFSPLGRRRG